MEELYFVGATDAHRKNNMLIMRVKAESEKIASVRRISWEDVVLTFTRKSAMIEAASLGKKHYSRFHIKSRKAF